MTQRLAFAIVRRYPAAWRERYEGEVCSLIDDSMIRLRDLAELARGLVTERARELVSSDERPRRTALVLGLFTPVFGLVFSCAAVLTGLGLRRVTGLWGDQALEYLLWGTVPCLVAFVVMLTRTRRRPWSMYDPPYPAWAGAILLPPLFVMVATTVWAGVWSRDTSSYSGTLGWVGANLYWFNLFYVITISADLSSSFWPTRRLLGVFAEIRVAEQQIKSNQQWVVGCHEMIAQGVPSPLAEAEAHLAQAKHRLEEVRQRLHSRGYRARFRATAVFPGFPRRPLSL